MLNCTSVQWKLFYATRKQTGEKYSFKNSTECVTNKRLYLPHTVVDELFVKSKFMILMYEFRACGICGISVCITKMYYFCHSRSQFSLFRKEFSGALILLTI